MYMNTHPHHSIIIHNYYNMHVNYMYVHVHCILFFNVCIEKIHRIVKNINLSKVKFDIPSFSPLPPPKFSSGGPWGGYSGGPGKGPPRGPGAVPGRGEKIGHWWVQIQPHSGHTLLPPTASHLWWIREGKCEGCMCMCVLSVCVWVDGCVCECIGVRVSVGVCVDCMELYIYIDVALSSIALFLS